MIVRGGEEWLCGLQIPADCLFSWIVGFGIGETHVDDCGKLLLEFLLYADSHLVELGL